MEPYEDVIEHEIMVPEVKLTEITVQVPHEIEIEIVEDKVFKTKKLVPKKIEVVT